MDLASLSTPAILTQVWGHLPIEMWRTEAQAALDAVRTTTDSPSRIVRTNFENIAKLRDIIDLSSDSPGLILYHLGLLHEVYVSALQMELSIRAWEKGDCIASSFERHRDATHKELVKHVLDEFGIDVSPDYVRTTLNGRRERSQ